MNILVLGDYCVDKYLPFSQITGIHDYSELDTAEVYKPYYLPGGAGNVTSNLLSLGVNVICLGVIGDDGDGYDLIKSLKQIGGNVEYMFVEEGRKTVSCIRPKSNGLFDIKLHEIICYNNYKISYSIIEKAKMALFFLIEKVDAIIVVEQFEQKGCGILHPEIKELISTLALQYPTKIIIADSREFIEDYENIFIKCNQYEYRKTKNNDFVKKNKVFFLTQGDAGMSVIANDFIQNVPAELALNNVYTCGAGDSATAGIVIGLLLGLDYIDAARLGNIVASITIRKLDSTGVATISEVVNRLLEYTN